MKKRWLLGFLFVAVLFGPGAAIHRAAATPNTSGDWVLVGPKELSASQETGDIGRINAFAFDPKDPQTIYAATPVGGLWRTQDDGAHWKLLLSRSDLGIQDIAIDPNSPNTLYILTGDGDGGSPIMGISGYGLASPSTGVLKSVDGGQTWQKTELHFDRTQQVLGYRLAIDPANPSILLAATTHGLWRTTDAGKTWSPAQAGQVWAPGKVVHFWDVEFAPPTNSSTVYAAALQASAGKCSTEVYRSADAGRTWVALRVGPGGLPNVGECNWFDRVRLAVTPANPKTLYVLYGASDVGFGGKGGFSIGLYRSVDGGNSFTKESATEPFVKGKPAPLDLTSKNVFGRDDNDGVSQTFYTMPMAVSPANADHVYVGGVDIFASTDGGKTWQRTSTWILHQDCEYGMCNPKPDQYVHADIHELAFQGGALFAATDGGIYRSRDQGRSWESVTRMHTGIAIAQIYYMCGSPQQPNTVYYGAQDTGTYVLHVSTGKVREILGGDGYVCQVDPRLDNVLYGDHDQQIVRNLDATNACPDSSCYYPVVPTGWRQILSGGPWVTPYILSPAEPTVGWYAGIFACAKDVLYAPDPTQGWQNLTNGALGTSPECRQIAISPADPNTIYVAKAGDSNDLRIAGLRTRDARPPFYGGPGVFRSTDGGKTWQSISAGLPLADARVSNLAVSPTDARRLWVTFLGYDKDAKVFQSTDGGLTWTNDSQGLPNNSVHIAAAVQGAGNPVYAGTDDGVYYRDNTMKAWLPFKHGLQPEYGGPLAVTSLVVQQAQHRLVAGTFGNGVWMSDLYSR